MAAATLLRRSTLYLRCVRNAPLLSLLERKIEVKQVRGNGSNSSRHKFSKQPVHFILGTAGVAIAAWTFHHFAKGRREHIVAAAEIFGHYKHGLPLYSSEDVMRESTEKKRVLVTYQQGVYDITDFVEKHPGGDKILLANGGSVEPFWMMYGIHKSPVVLAMLEEYRVGNLAVEDSTEAVSNMEDPYASEPARHPVLRASSQKPFNAEPPPALLVDSFITPTELFYVRNHLPVPNVDPKTYQLEISGIGVKDKSFSLNDLKKFPKHTVTAAVQCAGNRRSEMTEVKSVKGLSWGQAAIGNATWTGAKLCDVLRAAGLKENQPGIEHIQFEGLDTDVSNVPYGASIPIEKALDPQGDVILAYKMNGEPLSRDHGYPIRVIVPGTVGARNVKWLGRIIVSGDESDSHWQQNDYKGFSPSVDWDTVDFSKSPAIQELPVTSAICDPQPGDMVRLEDGKCVIRGYAWSGGGRKIVRVDITANQGKSWQEAELINQDHSKAPRHWAWTLWEARISIPKGIREVEFWAKAVDSSYNTQPESFKNIWNLRGVLSNAYHRVKVKIQRI